jgi:hypothetical protein
MDLTENSAMTACFQNDVDLGSCIEHLKMFSFGLVVSDYLSMITLLCCAIRFL